VTVTATIKNDDRLLRKLTRIPQAMREQIRIAMAKEADEIVAMAQRLAPSSPGGGTLRASIGWRWGDKAPSGTMSLGQVKAPSEFGSALTLTIFAGGGKAFYARFVEFGTVKMGKRPFFFPSYRARRKPAKNAIRRAVRTAAKQVAAGN
jgi:HK97 gp10 family phage protein